MGRFRFVQPQTVRLPLSDGEWIEVKRELTAGEQRHVFGQMVREYSREDGHAILDPEKVGRTKVSAYLVAWSAQDAAGVNVAVSDDAIDNLDTRSYNEIVSAIEAHETATEQAFEKNGNGGESKTAAISPSVAP